MIADTKVQVSDEMQTKWSFHFQDVFRLLRKMEARVIF